MFEEAREKDHIMQTLGPEVAREAFAYAISWPKFGGRIPCVPSVDSHDILAGSS